MNTLPTTRCVHLRFLTGLLLHFSTWFYFKIIVVCLFCLSLLAQNTLCAFVLDSHHTNIYHLICLLVTTPFSRLILLWCLWFFPSNHLETLQLIVRNAHIVGSVPVEYSASIFFRVASVTVVPLLLPSQFLRFSWSSYVCLALESMISYVLCRLLRLIQLPAVHLVEVGDFNTEAKE